MSLFEAKDDEEFDEVADAVAAWGYGEWFMHYIVLLNCNHLVARAYLLEMGKRAAGSVAMNKTSKYLGPARSDALSKQV